MIRRWSIVRSKGNPPRERRRRDGHSLCGIERLDGIQDRSRECRGLLLASALEGKGHTPSGRMDRERERAARGREFASCIYVRAQRTGGRRRQADEDGRQCDDDAEAGKARRVIEKKERAYCGQFPPRTKDDGSWARQATGTGTVEWRSASVGMLS